MNVEFHSYTDIGAREINEDAYEIANSDGRGVFVLCDGLGGYESGEVASKMAAEGFADALSECPQVSRDGIEQIAHAVNGMLTEKQKEDPRCSSMRTTVVGCVLEGGRMLYFNVGDSRFYYFRNGTVYGMTKDHSVPQMEVELGELTFDKIRFDPDRNKLLRVLGEPRNTELCSVYGPINCQPGDAFLMCSDGFWEYVLEEEMEIDLSKSETPEEWVKYMLVRLFLRMNGSNDNYTLIGGMIR